MNIPKITHCLCPEPATSQRARKDAGFEEVFNLKLAELHPTLQVSADDVRKNVVKLGESVLNLLGDHANDLTNPSRKLRDMAPVIAGIEEKVRQIESMTEKASNDAAFDKFVKDLLVTATVAAYKFHRGDYI